jgi:hypothetical protein
MGRWFASVTSERLPSTLLADEGTNFTEKLAPCPGERTSGSLRPATLKPAPMTLAWLIPIVALPIFATVTTCELAFPTVALTERLLGVTESCGRGSANPAQPETQAEATRIDAKTISTNTLLTRHSLMMIKFSVVASSFFRVCYAQFCGFLVGGNQVRRSS